MGHAQSAEPSPPLPSPPLPPGGSSTPPAGESVPTPSSDTHAKSRSFEPQRPSARKGVSVFLLAFLPWGVLAPLNVLKLQLNKVSPGAHLWVPAETEQCQAACGIARMWATLFWSLQFAGALSSIYLHYHREVGLAIFSTANKVVVGAVLLKAYFDGVIYWPIGLVGAGCEWVFALAFMRELRR